MNLLPLLLGLTAQSNEPIQVTIDTRQTTVAVNPAMYGIFFEEINQAGEGGLYGELLRTRGMEDGDATKLPTGWQAVGEAGRISLDATSVPNEGRPHSLRIERVGAGQIAAVNEGFWGVPLKNGARYRLTMWVRGDAEIDATLEGAGGQRLGNAVIPKSGNEWRRIERTITASGDDNKAKLVLTPKQLGTVWVGYASLMPLDTWRGRSNGFRKDLAEHVSALKPGFVRFPGGCFIEGQVLGQAFDWKKSIGPVEARRPMPRSFWGYPTSNGLGYHEYLQWCEDLGSRALFVANCGMSHSEIAPTDKMDRYVQDALDAIEYANGPATSKWGALRAKNGHAKPFNLRYIQIGNENGGPNYDVRYAMMAKAIKARYPEIQLVANVWDGVPQSYPLEIIDEHYYSNPAFFWRNANRYDAYDRKGPQIYVGEYAVTRGSGQGNLDAALSEAAFMAGMERNADVVRMASYAPLFVNVNNRQWNPNAVVFDNTRSYGTPSYWVQWIYSNHRPDRILKHEVRAPLPQLEPVAGRVGLQTWRTQAEFRDIEVEADGRKLFSADQVSGDRLEILRGEWTTANGAIRQSSDEENRQALLRGVEIPRSQRATLRLKARKISGAEGFIIMMGLEPGREFQWNLGGWNNTVHAFQRDGERVGRGVPGQIETGRWYDIRIEREGNVSRAYLDGKLVEELREAGTPNFTAVAGVDEKANEIVIKAVNGAGTARTVQFDFTGGRVGSTARGLVMTGNRLDAENSLSNPDRIRPRPFSLNGVSGRLSQTLPPYSVTVLRIPRR